MFLFILNIIKVFLLPLNKAKQELLLDYSLVKLENLILKRKLITNKKRLRFSWFTKLIYSVFSKILPKIKKCFTLITPETVLKWYHNLIKSFWIFPHKNPKVGRPAVPLNVRNLILEMKNNNIGWGVKRIRDELAKLEITLHKKTISNILKDFRRKGRIKKALSWSSFIKSHLSSLFAMDFLTIDTIFNKRFYVLFFLCVKTRQIVSFHITQYPCLEFVRQRIILLQEALNRHIHLIHDRDNLFHLSFSQYNITSVKTSVQAPNMNAYAERFIRSVRNEALDYFIIFNEFQLKNILEEYITYYNSKRPHQGIDGKIPDGYIPQTKGEICSKKVVYGLHNHYYRLTA